MKNKNITLIILAIICITFIGCERQDKSLLESRNELLQKKNDSLNRKLEIAKEAIVVLQDRNAWYDPEYDNADFKKKGIADSEKFIKDEFGKRTDLIPLQPALGGKMSFGTIQLLGSKFLIADYEDGHVEGKSIYSYKLNDSGKIEFKLIGSEEN
ncbi:hypothetical protein OD917_01900 [Flavobacterium sp. SH_e]|uniref:hypothetical protein n=1 Tax=Flavobacterium sp. SH_e TaxID=2983767 RepID=UPI0021E4BDEB|nr:hypothetical protein [Flavobacterium sp. SH_e]MCV2483661.1 hypothetical protein [Flavobacterium sp. SH_e]